MTALWIFGAYVAGVASAIGVSAWLRSLGYTLRRTSDIARERHGGYDFDPTFPKR